MRTGNKKPVPPCPSGERTQVRRVWIDAIVAGTHASARAERPEPRSHLLAPGLLPGQPPSVRKVGYRGGTRRNRRTSRPERPPCATPTRPPPVPRRHAPSPRHGPSADPLRAPVLPASLPSPIRTITVGSGFSPESAARFIRDEARRPLTGGAHSKRVRRAVRGLVRAPAPPPGPAITAGRDFHPTPKEGSVLLDWLFPVNRLARAKVHLSGLYTLADSPCMAC